jgi:hypothetical protein
MIHNHQTHSYPAHKMIPKIALAKGQQEWNKIQKKQHIKRVRRYNKHLANDV